MRDISGGIVPCLQSLRDVFQHVTEVISPCGHVHAPGRDVDGHVEKLRRNVEGYVIQHPPAVYEGSSVVPIVEFAIFSELQTAFVINLFLRDKKQNDRFSVTYKGAMKTLLQK